MENKIDVLLLVEDDDNDIIITGRKIEKSNVQIGEFLITRTLEETITLLNRRRVDLVLLDLNLPDSRGLDTVDGVRSVYDGIIIVLTSIDDERVGVDAIRKGADEYLVKSQLTEKTLGTAIQHAVERKKRWALVHSVNETISKLDQMLSR